jgi:aminopeptidase N
VTTSQLDVVSALLDGNQSLPGFVVDAERRWELLRSLAAGGRATEADIEREVERDDTASGRVHAAAARAAIPLPSAKSDAWKLVVDDARLPNAVQAAVISGFNWAHDRSLLEPFVEPYFEALTRVWTDRTSEMATQIIVGMYPSTVGSQRVVDLTDAWLEANPDVEPALRRLVAEGRDGVARALRAQDRDRRG